jgi:putative ABC transport system permease protein
MAFVPLSYTTRSMLERRASTALTVVAIGATVAVVSGVLALQQGFVTLFTQSGRTDVALLLRPGATSEGESGFPRERAATLLKELPEVALDAQGVPLASGELYLAVRREKEMGGETNVPIRGIQAQAFAIHGDALRIVEGRKLEFGRDEIVVGRSLVGRILGCRVGGTVKLNTIEFTVVGVFDHDGPYASEIWGDVERMQHALQRPGFSSVRVKLNPDVDVEAMAKRLEDHPTSPCKVMSERGYLEAQTKALSFVLLFLGNFLATIMGVAAVFTGTNTMLSSLAARTHEIGILLAIGFRPFAVFLSFLVESVLIGLVGGALGCLMALPLNGVRTGTTNFQTFTEVAFAFRITPTVLLYAVSFSLILGILAGTIPAWFAARLRPTQALRRE